MKRLKIFPNLMAFGILLTVSCIQGVFRASNIRRLQESDLNSPSVSLMGSPSTPISGISTQSMQQGPVVSQASQQVPSMPATTPTALQLSQLPQPPQLLQPQIPQNLQTPIGQPGIQILQSPQMPTLSQIQTTQIQPNQMYQQTLAKNGQRPLLETQSFVQQPTSMMNTSSSPYPQSTIYPTNQNPVTAGISSLASNHMAHSSMAPQTPGGFMNRYPSSNPNGVTNEAFAMLHTMVNQSSRRQDGRCSMTGPDWPMSGSSVWTLSLHRIVYENINPAKLMTPFSIIQFAFN